MKPFSIQRDRCFQLSFNNGYTISVQFGEFSCCDGVEVDENGAYSADTAEIAILHNDDFVTKHVMKSMYGEDYDNDFLGNCTTDAVAAFITFVANLRSKT